MTQTATGYKCSAELTTLRECLPTFWGIEDLFCKFCAYSVLNNLLSGTNKDDSFDKAYHKNDDVSNSNGSEEENYDNENGWRHDQTLKHEFVSAGVGFDYIFSERYGVSVNYYRTIEADNLLEVDKAFNVGLTRRF